MVEEIGDLEHRAACPGMRANKCQTWDSIPNSLQCKTHAFNLLGLLYDPAVQQPEIVTKEPADGP